MWELHCNVLIYHVSDDCQYLYDLDYDLIFELVNEEKKEITLKDLPDSILKSLTKELKECYLWKTYAVRNATNY